MTPIIKGFECRPENQKASIVCPVNVRPDLSVIVKARKGGADYIYSLLIGYEDLQLVLKDHLTP